MAKPVFAMIVVIGLLGAALVYSKIRPQENKVSGFFEADEIRVGSRVGGRVLIVNVAEGDKVTKGQVLVELEPFDLREKRAEAEQLLAQAKSNLARLNAGFRKEEIAQARAKRDQLKALFERTKKGPREEEIEVAAEEVKLAQSVLQLAQSVYDRVKPLYERKIETQQKYDEVVNNLQVARAQVSVNQKNYTLLKKGSRQEDIDHAKARLDEAEQAMKLKENGYRKEDINAAKASVSAVQESLNAIDHQIKELKILAPFDGIVEAIELQPGDLVNANAPAISLVDMNKLWIRAYVPEKYLKLNIGDPVGVTIDSYANKKFQGKVVFIARKAEFTPGNVQTPEERSKQVFRIKVLLENKADLKLRPGLTTDIWLNEAE